MFALTNCLDKVINVKQISTAPNTDFYVQTACEFHDLKMDFVVWRQLSVYSTIASNNYTHTFMQEYKTMIYQFLTFLFSAKKPSAQ